LNEDDHTTLEFSFARDLGRGEDFAAEDIALTAESRGQRDRGIQGEVNWSLVREHRMAFAAAMGFPPRSTPRWNGDENRRAAALAAWVAGRFGDAVAIWRTQAQPPQGLTEIAALAESMADVGDESSLALEETLRIFLPGEADAIVGRLRLRQGRTALAAEAVSASLHRYREDPWPSVRLMLRTVNLAAEIAKADPTQAPRMYEALEHPFAARLLDEARRRAAMRITRSNGALASRCVEPLAEFEPDVPWERAFLQDRLQCYAMNHSAPTDRAEADLSLFTRDAPPRFGDGLSTQSEPTK
jgi:hypothetical protein